MRKCSICKEDKDVSEYNSHPTRKDRLQAACKECNRIKGKEWYENNKKAHMVNVKKRKNLAKQLLSEYLKDKKCERCPENDPVCLEFDHIDRTQKKHHICTMVLRNFSWTAILEEIGKCRILCANCHHKKTAIEDNHYKHRIKSV